MPKALRKVASSMFAPAKTEPIWTLSKPVIKVFVNGGGGLPLFCMPCRLVLKNPEPATKMFANGGGAAPNPPAFFLRHAGCLSRKSHQQELRQTRSCYGVCLSHHTGCLFANAGVAFPPTPPRYFLAVQDRCSYHPRSKDKTHMDPLRTRDKGAPLLFDTMQADFKYLRTSKDRTHMDPLRTRDK